MVNTSGSGKVTLNEYMEFVRKRANGTGAASVNTVVWERWFYR